MLNAQNQRRRITFWISVIKVLACCLYHGTSACPDGWNDNEDSCYKLLTDEVPWSEAKDACAEFSAFLVSIGDQEEQNYLQNNFRGSDPWLGLKYDGGQWLWDDGTAFSFNFWDNSNSESESGENKECAYIDLKDSNKWIKLDCDERKKGLCKGDEDDVVVPPLTTAESKRSTQDVTTTLEPTTTQKATTKTALPSPITDELPKTESTLTATSQDQVDTQPSTVVYTTSADKIPSGKTPTDCNHDEESCQPERTVDPASCSLPEVVCVRRDLLRLLNEALARNLNVSRAENIMDRLNNIVNISFNDFLAQDFTMATDIFRHVILAEPLRDISDNTVAQGFISSVVTTGSTLLNPTTRKQDQTLYHKDVFDIIMTLDGFSEDVSKHVLVTESDTFQVDSNNIDLNAVLISGNSDENLAVVETVLAGTDVMIPVQLVNQSVGSLGVVTALYRDLKKVLPEVMIMKTDDISNDEDAQTEVQLSSRMLCLTVHPKPTIPFLQPIRMKLHKHAASGLLTCGYLVHDSYARDIRWQSDGCKTAEETTDYVICECSHTTNFAVLMQVSTMKIDEDHQFALSIISKVGCSISLTCLVLTFITLIYLKLTSDRVIILLNLVAVIALTQLLFLFGIQATGNYAVCKGVAVALHYLCLATFFWMLIEGIQLYTKVRTVFLGSRNMIIYYCLLGWLGPALIVVISASVKFRLYGSDTVCWLSTQEGMIFAFVGPAMAVILVNIGVLIFVMKAFMNVKINAKKTDSQKIRAGIRASLVLVPLLGLTWVFGIFAVNEATVVFQYVFALVNSLQGVFIFIFHCLLNDEVKTAFKKRHRIDLSTTTDNIQRSSTS
ncbi:adhesion G protein-coupled receptor E3-like isoform X2 [Ptychodera flava]|uniref:adhesion G protein-coupled receptor E3-like isoform X2 n=1 Tax=Ptychodera flava TaxID=63121 RepID=UPI00396AA130